MNGMTEIEENMWELFFKQALQLDDGTSNFFTLKKDENISENTVM